MSINWTEKEEIYSIASFAANSLLTIAALFVIAYFLAPLLGGKLSIDAIIHYASWIILALAVKYFLRRARKGLKIRLHDYALIYVCSVINLVIWFSYPLNIVVSILFLIATFYSYRARKEQVGL